MTSDYNQSATYKLFEVGHDLRYLKDRCIDQSAYSVLNKIYVLLNTLNSRDFAEDKDGNILHDLVPAYKPSWKR